MAVTALSAPESIGQQVVLYTWAAIPNGNTGAPIKLENFNDLTATIEGTFGTGGSCTLQGSNDGTNYYSLTDPQGNAITKTAAGLESVTELPVYVRPSVTAGDGTTAIDVRIVARRGAR